MISGIPYYIDSFHNALVNDLGFGLISTFLSCTLYGFGCLQTYMYYKRYQQDSYWIRFLPAWLFAMQTASVIMLCVGEFKPLIFNFGNYGVVLVKSPPENFFSLLFQGLISITAQFFFIYRIWKYAKSQPMMGTRVWIFSFICVTLAIALFGLVLVLVSLGPVHKYSLIYLATDATWGSMTYAIVSINLLLDAVLALAMLWLLHHEGSLPFSGANFMLRRLMVMTVNSGLLAMTVALAGLVLRVVYPEDFAYAFCYLLLGPVYWNTVLANLNVRDYIRSGMCTHGKDSTRSEPTPAAIQLPTRDLDESDHPESRRDVADQTAEAADRPDSAKIQPLVVGLRL